MQMIGEVEQWEGWRNREFGRDCFKLKEMIR